MVRPTAARAPADDAVLVPAFAALTDQRTAGVALTGVLSAAEIAGTEHVLREPRPHVAVDLLARVPRYRRHDHLPQDVPAARIYIRTRTFTVNGYKRK